MLASAAPLFRQLLGLDPFRPCDVFGVLSAVAPRARWLVLTGCCVAFTFHEQPRDDGSVNSRKYVTCVVDSRAPKRAKTTKTRSWSPDGQSTGFPPHEIARFTAEKVVFSNLY